MLSITHYRTLNSKSASAVLDSSVQSICTNTDAAAPSTKFNESARFVGRITILLLISFGIYHFGFIAHDYNVSNTLMFEENTESKNLTSLNFSDLHQENLVGKNVNNSHLVGMLEDDARIQEQHQNERETTVRRNLRSEPSTMSEEEKSAVRRNLLGRCTTRNAPEKQERQLLEQ